MIEIKTLFDGWIPATKEKALDYAKFLYKSVMTMSDYKLVEYINTKKIRGISFTKEELEVKNDRRGS